MQTGAQEVPGEQARVVLSALDIRATLRAEIEHGTLPPGMLIDERRYAQRFNVSRTKLRQALHLLAGDHLVRTEPYVGTRVTRLSISELRDLLESCCEMEVLIAKFAARRMSATARQAIEAAQQACRQEACKPDGQHQSANARFHDALHAAACSPHLAQLLVQSRRLLLRYIPPLATGSASLLQSLDEHEAIMQAIFAHDEAQAMQRMAMHLPAGSTGFSEFLARIPGHFFSDQ